jgi:hypothetical protein
LTGCSLLYAPSSDLTSGGPDRGEGGSGGEGALPESGAETSTDAGSEASVAFSCPSNALVCDDFERDSVLGPFPNAGGNVSISTTRAHSPTRSLSAILAATGSSR